MQDLFPTTVYVLCFLTSSACALLLARNYRRSGAQLLFWSALSFLFLAVNNFLVIMDIIVLGGSLSLQLLRLFASLAAVSVLLFGFIWRLEE